MFSATLYSERFTTKTRPDSSYLSIATSVILMGFIWLICLAPSSPFRYLVYLSPIIILADRLIQRALVFADLKFCAAISLTAVILGAAALRGPSPEQALFIILGPACALAKFRFRKAAADVMFLGLAAIQIYVAISKGFSLNTNTITTSVSAAETNSLPFLLSIFALYFVINRRWAATIFAIALLVIAGKRIALLSVLVALPLTIVAGIFWEKIKYTSSIIYVAIFSIATLIALKIPEISLSLSNKFLINVNVLTMGRFRGQRLAYSELAYSNGWDLIFGHGVGHADRLAAIAWNSLKIPVHNDYVRIILDVGWLGAATIFFTYALMLRKTLLGISFLAFLTTSWATDNLLIYVFFVTSMILLSRTDDDTSGSPHRMAIRVP